jgi:hypothetical protein
MKKYLFTIIILLSNTLTFAQFELKGTMGIYFTSIPSMQDYVNQQSFVSFDDQIGSFVSSVMFAGEAGIFISPGFETTLELAYLLYSYTNGSSAGQYDLTFSNLMPTVFAYYVIAGEGYNFKFGGGLGPRFVTVDESFPATGLTKTYNSVGYGVVGRLEGNTLLGSSVYANIGADIRYDVNGEPENAEGEKLVNTSQNEVVNFNALSFGVRLGITYIIGGNN